MSFLNLLKEHKWLILILVLSLALRMIWIDTLIERDEGEFGYVAWSWLTNQEPNIEYPPSQPPLLYLLYLIPIYFLGSSIISVRMLNNLIFLISIIFLYKLTNKLYNKKVGVYSSAFYGFFMNAPVFEGQLAMGESFLIPFVIISLFYYVSYLRKNKHSSLIFSFIFAFLSLLIKIHGIILITLLTIHILIFSFKKRVLTALMLILILILGILMIILIFFLNGWDIKILLWGIIYPITGYTYNLTFLPNYYSYNLQTIFLSVVEGLMLWPSLIIGLLWSLINIKKNLAIKKNNSLILLWFIFFGAVAIIPPSYGHYLILILPPASIFAGLGINSFIKKIKKNTKKVAYILLGLFLFFTITSIFFQMQHYPDFNVDWRWIHVRYSDFETRSAQKELIAFLNNDSNEKGVIVFGWSNDIYWLTNNELILSTGPGMCNKDILNKSKTQWFMNLTFMDKVVIALDKKVIFTQMYITSNEALDLENIFFSSENNNKYPKHIVFFDKIYPHCTWLIDKYFPKIDILYNKTQIGNALVYTRIN